MFPDAAQSRLAATLAMYVALAKAAFLAVHIGALELVYVYELAQWLRDRGRGTGGARTVNGFVLKYVAVTAAFAGVVAYVVDLLFGGVSPLTRLFLKLFVGETAVVAALGGGAGLLMQRQLQGDREMDHGHAHAAKIVKEVVTRVVVVFTVTPLTLVVLAVTPGVLWR